MRCENWRTPLNCRWGALELTNAAVKTDEPKFHGVRCPIGERT